MSILIKGMEIPTSCFYCPFREKVNPDDYVCMALNKEFEETFSLIVGKRHKDCPLVPVPPHGDLIERDPLRASIRESIDECHKWADEMREAENEEMVIRAEQSLGTFVECGLRVKNAPTIIPAEEGE